MYLRAILFQAISFLYKYLFDLNYNSVHGPNGGEDDAVKDEGKWEGLGGPGAHHMRNGSQRSQTVAH